MKVWQKIAKEITETGTNVTWEQCETKFRYLKLKYKECLENNRQTGRERKTFQFYQVQSHNYIFI